MGPLCCLAASGHDGTTYLSFFSFFWDPLLLFLLLVPSHLLLSLQLHISQRSAFGISPLKSPSAVPTAAMTTAGELRVSESTSVIVCLIANFWAMGANMCAYSTDTWAAYFPFILTSVCSSLWACASLAVFVKLVVEWSIHVPEHKPSSVITGRVDTSYSKKGGKTRVSAASRAEGVITEGLVWSWYGLRWQKPPHLRRTFMDTQQLQYVSGDQWRRAVTAAAATTGRYYVLAKSGLYLMSSFKKGFVRAWKSILQKTVLSVDDGSVGIVTLWRVGSTLSVFEVFWPK